MDAETPLPVPSGHLRVAVITPEGAAYEGDARSVVLAAHDGEVAFLPGHAPFVGALGTGELRIGIESGETLRFFLDGGVVQVLENVVSILAEDVEPEAAVTVREKEIREELLAALGEIALEDEAFLEKVRRVERARVRIRIAGGSPTVES